MGDERIYVPNQLYRVINWIPLNYGVSAAIAKISAWQMFRKKIKFVTKTTFLMQFLCLYQPNLRKF